MPPACSPLLLCIQQYMLLTHTLNRHCHHYCHIIMSQYVVDLTPRPPDDSDVGLLDLGNRGVTRRVSPSGSRQPIVHFEGSMREPHSPNYDLRDDSTTERSHPKRYCVQCCVLS